MILAFDCDLRKAYGVTSTGMSWKGVAPHACPLLDDRRLELVLIEVADATDYTNSKAIAHQKRRWALWNMACATRLTQQVGDRVPVLVAPSSQWTRGYDLKTRHALAKCVQPQKDLREAECMLWMYKTHPVAWQPLWHFLNAL